MDQFSVFAEKTDFFEHVPIAYNRNIIYVLDGKAKIQLIYGALNIYRSLREDFRQLYFKDGWVKFFLSKNGLQSSLLRLVSLFRIIALATNI